MKIKKIIAFGVGALLISFLLYLYVGFQGNPISKLVINSRVSGYLEKEFPKNDFQLEGAQYNFKDGSYSVKVQSKSSIDTHFYVNYNWLGEVKGDTYEAEVTSHWNTYQRLEQEYRELVDKSWLNKEFHLTENDILFGTLQDISEVEKKSDGTNLYSPYGLNIPELKLDYPYHIQDIGKKAGTIVIYIPDQDVSIKRAAELMLQIKTYLDQKNVSFYALDFVLQSPNPNDETRVNVGVFLYSDIYEEGMEKRVEKAHQKLEDYYRGLDNQKS